MSRTIRKEHYDVCGYNIILNPHRDKKKWYKPVKWFKKMRLRIRRAKEKQALRTGKEIPFFRKSDGWYWN